MITVETIRERHSVREYDGKSSSGLSSRAWCRSGGIRARKRLDIQLVGDNPEVFNVIARFGLIRGCRTHVAFVVDDAKAGDVAADEAIGYWGQKIVLAAQDMGSIRAGARCARARNRAPLWRRGRKFAWSLRWATGKRKAFHGRRKNVEALSSVECAKRRRGLRRPWKAAQLAPTAMNNQNFKITLLSERETVRIDAPQSGLNVIDEGIVRCNFEIAANEAGADWRWERDI